MNVILRSTESKVINIPSKIWKEIGWNVGDEIELVICENLNSKGQSWNSISVDRTKDEETYREDEEV
jgi:antitoxin component of MazEF toxin-antitoxin module